MNKILIKQNYQLKDVGSPSPPVPQAKTYASQDKGQLPDNMTNSSKH